MSKIILETKRLILRQPEKSDWKDIMEGAGEYDVAKMLSTAPHPYKRKDADWYINKLMNEWKEKVKKSLTFLIVLKSENKVIGTMAMSKVDMFQGIATTGSWINKKYWKNGYITEAKIAVNDFAFNKLKLRRLNSQVVVNNIASNKTQEKMGYKLEGIMRKAGKNKLTGKIFDLNIYGLLKEDWKKIRPKLVKEFKSK